MSCVSAKTLGSACALAALASISTPGLAQGAANNPHLRFSQEYEYTFSEIGAVGNKPVTTHINGDPPFITTQRGTVDHRYRIMTREVTVGEYLEFANTAGMHYAQLGFNTRHIGGDALQAESLGGGAVEFHIISAVSPSEPMRTSFAGMVMFANWLHNDKQTGIEAFQNGAYDLSTFRPVPGDLVPRGQDTHNEDARFWIPTTDEWLKAGYYDPNRYGEGEGGWWEQPNASDTPLIPGRPELGGETNGGSQDQWPSGQERPLDGGLYPDVHSPWGLIDVSGGASEWTETLSLPQNPLAGGRIHKGTDARLRYDLLFDDVSELASRGTGSGTLFGIRLATVVPAPGGAAVLAVGSGALLCSRKRKSCTRSQNGYS